MTATAEPIEGNLVAAKSTSVARRPTARAEDSSPAGMIAYAMRSNASIAELRELYAFKKEFEADEAKKAFNIAIAAFKENPPVIVRDKENKQFNSKYSSLANTVQKTNEALARHGLNATWDLVQTAGGISVTCILTHEQGHSERVTLTAPPDSSGGNSKNAIQQMKSTITYLRGVTFEAVTGVVTSDKAINADDDGNGAAPRGASAQAAGPADPERDHLVANLRAVADEGSARLEESWRALTGAQRKRVGNPALDELKARAAQADARVRP